MGTKEDNMCNFKKRIALVMTALTLTAGMLTGCGKTVDKNAVTATVNGDEITLGTANFYARYHQAMFETQYGAYLGENIWGTMADEEKNMEESTKDSVMESLKQMYVLEDHMEDYGIEITDEEKAKIEEASKKFMEANSKEVNEVISADEETVSRILTLITIEDKMRDEIIKDVDQDVADEDAAQKSMEYVFFSTSKTNDEGQSQEMSDEEKAEVKTKAEEYIQGAKTAEDLKAYTEEAGYTLLTKSFDSEDIDPSEEMIKAADQLKEGEFTEVIETETGYYVAKLTSEFDPEATELEKKNIVLDRQNEKYTEVVDGFMKDAKIDVNEKEWKKISFSGQSVKMKMEAPQEEQEK